MKIYSAKTVRVEKWVEVKVSHGARNFKISVTVVDGRLEYANHKNGLATSYITYFNRVPEHIRARHYRQIKKWVERYIK